MNTIHSNIPLKDIYYEEMDVVTKYDKGSICEEMYLLKHQRAIPENSFDTVEIFHFNVFLFLRLHRNWYSTLFRVDWAIFDVTVQ